MGRHIVKYKINRNILPPGYTQLGYIESNKSQYINTNFKANQDTKVEVEFELKTTTNKQAVFFGSSGNLGASSFGFYAGSSGTRYSNYNSDTNISSVFTPLLNTRYKYTQDKNKVYVNDELLYTHPTQTFQSTLDLEIGRANVSTYADTFLFVGKFYSFKLWDNGVLILNMVPAKNSSNIAGMYDLENDTFYTSSSGTAYVAGPETNDTARGLVLTRIGETPPEVPEGYTAVQSIYSNGYQYFETAWIPDFTKDFTVEGKVGFVTTSRGMWIANFRGSNELSIELNSNLGLRFYKNGDICNLTTAAVLKTLYNAVITYTASTGIVNMSYSSTTSTVRGTVPAGERIATTTTAYFGADRWGHRYPYGLYGPVKVTQGGVEILNYQPAKRNSDGAYGMWDYTTNQFYESETTTGFLGNEYVIDIKAHAIKTAEVNN